MNNLRKILEEKLWVLPLIKKMSENYSITITSMEGVFESLGYRKWIHPIEKNTSEAKLEYALKQVIRLSRKWHMYGDLHELLQINGVNVGELAQQMMMDLFFPFFMDVDNAELFLKNEKPDIVYIQNDLFTLESALHTVALAHGIQASFFEPRIYRHLKKKLHSYFAYKLYKSFNFPRFSGLYLLNGVQCNESNCRILMDLPYINDFNAVFPVIQELINRGICECYILGDRSVLSKRFRNIEPVKIRNKTVYKRKMNPKELSKYYHSKLKRDSCFQAIFTYRGMNFWDAVKESIHLLFDRKFIDIIHNINYFDTVIQTIKPNLLVVADDRAIRVRGHVLLAKHRGIPVLDIQHGVYLPTRPFDTPIADKLAAGGNYTKRVYIKYGAREDQVVVTGWPKFDIYKKLKDNSFKRKRKEKLNILFATSPLDFKLNLDIIETISLFIKDSLNLRLMVKPHPIENTKMYDVVSKKHKTVTLCESKEDITKLLALSDLLIFFSSDTVGLEALLLDKPIICINMTNKEAIYVSSGVAVEVKNLQDIIPAIMDTLYSEESLTRLAEKRKRFVYEHTYLHDGQASKRVTDLILQMIKRNNEEVVLFRN